GLDTLAVHDLRRLLNLAEDIFRQRGGLASELDGGAPVATGHLVGAEKAVPAPARDLQVDGKARRRAHVFERWAEGRWPARLGRGGRRLARSAVAARAQDTHREGGEEHEYGRSRCARHISTSRSVFRS